MLWPPGEPGEARDGQDGQRSVDGRRDGRTEDAMPYNVAIIGAGAWSQNHVTGWRAQPDATITWVVRSTDAKARERATLWGVPNWSADYRQVLERDDVQIVDILLPHDLHAEVACLALAHGKHVVLEKPIATTLAGARQIAEAARRYQRKVMVSENWV